MDIQKLMDLLYHEYNANDVVSKVDSTSFSREKKMVVATFEDKDFPSDIKSQIPNDARVDKGEGIVIIKESESV